MNVLEYDDQIITSNPCIIKMDEAGKLLTEYLRFEKNITFTHLESYNHAIKNDITNLILSTSINLSENTQIPSKSNFHEVKFENLTFITGNQTPQTCREDNTTYFLQIYVDLIEYYKNEIVNKATKVYVGSIPLMVGSAYCVTHNKTPDQLRELRECPYDPKGYFIIDGKERVILFGEMLRSNKPLLFFDKDKNKQPPGRVVSRTTCQTQRGTTIVQMYMGKKGVIKLYLSGFKKSDKNRPNTIGALQIIRILSTLNGQSYTESQIRDLFIKFTKPEHRNKILNILEPSLINLKFITDDFSDIATKIKEFFKSNESRRKKKRANDATKMPNLDLESERISHVSEIIHNELYPYLNNEGSEKAVREAKIILQVITTIQLCEYLTGYRKLDDRDSWINKKLITQGRYIYSLFKAIWNKEFIPKIFKSIKNNATFNNILSEVKSNDDLSEGFSKSFTSGNWGVKNSNQKQNVTQPLKTESLIQRCTHLNQMDVDTSRNDKTDSIRQIQNSQLGFVCCVKTPEGGNVGIVKYLACTARVTYRDEDDISTGIRKMISGHYVNEQDEIHNCLLLVNYKFLGWAEGKVIESIIRKAKRNKLIPIYTSVAYDDISKIIWIYSDSGRLVRPLLVVEDNELVIDKKNLWGASWDTIVSNGCVEYVDAFEQEYLNIAIYYSTVRKIKNPNLNGFEEQNFVHLNQQEVFNFTHCEINPAAIVGHSAAVIPFPEDMQAPRSIFTCNMEEQALGVNLSNHYERFDSTLKTLVNPSRPLFECEVSYPLNLEILPAGEQSTMALALYTGFNIEDGDIVNRAAIDLGYLNYIKWSTYDTTTSSSKEFIEIITKPPSIPLKDQWKYENIGDNGLPILGRMMQPEQCIIGKVHKNLATGQLTVSSEFMGVGEYGMVYCVYVSRRNAETLVKVKIMHYRRPIVGDKEAPRNAQKATIAAILDHCDMMVSQTGEVPIYVKNSHCMPSRMTMPLIKEMWGGRDAAMMGRRYNSSIFRNFDQEILTESLNEHGFARYGKQQMYSGFSGRPIVNLVFMGPIYVMLLKHHVKDKYQSRQIGRIKSLTHQPVGGRSVPGGSGVQYGEMETAAAMSHGVATFLKERLGADLTYIVYCKRCGIPALPNLIGDKMNFYICTKCGSTIEEKGNFGKVSIPYVYKLLDSYLRGLDYLTSFKLSTREDLLKKIIREAEEMENEDIINEDELEEIDNPEFEEDEDNQTELDKIENQI